MKDRARARVVAEVMVVPSRVSVLGMAGGGRHHGPNDDDSGGGANLFDDLWELSLGWSVLGLAIRHHEPVRWTR